MMNCLSKYSENMPRRCSVKGCKSYAEKVATFSFPRNDNIKRQWISALNRPEFTPSQHSAICLNHFMPDDLEKFHRVDGNITDVPLKALKLKPDAVPSVFPGRHHSTYSAAKEISSVNPPNAKRRCDPTTRKLNVIHNQNEELLRQDKIKDFEEFKASYKRHLDLTDFQVFEEARLVVFYILSLANEEGQRLNIPVQIQIRDNLKIRVLQGEEELYYKDLKWIISKDMCLTLWSQLINLMTYFKNNQKGLELNIFHYIDCARKALDNVASLAEDDDDFKHSGEIIFIKEQLRLMISKRRQYDPSTLEMSFLIHNVSPSAFREMRSFFLLPNPTYLRQLSSRMNLSIDNDNSNLIFLKQSVAAITEEKDKFVALLIDEIHIRPQVVYKGGNVYGYADNDPTKSAKTAQTFMVSSVYGRFKQVIAIIPVIDCTGNYLFDLLKNALLLIKEAGLQTVAIVTDNNKVNQNLYNHLTESFDETPEGNKTKFLIRNPIDEQSKIFLLYDTVHIFKNVRNNWINRKDPDKTFLFPKFETFEIEKASWSDLENIYSSEKELTVRQAHRLTYQALHPDSIERQKVILVHNVFHESTIASLKSRGFNETSDFMEVIKKWWTICNVKNPLLGTLKRNEWQRPFYSDADFRMNFLRDFLEWLNIWCTEGNTACLTKETYNAIVQTTEGLISFITYSIRVKNVPYFLPGKIQTDPLEKRFSRYRFLSGTNYHVSFNNLIESEKKIRLQKILRFGNILDYKMDFDDQQSQSTLPSTLLSKYLPILDTDYLEHVRCDNSANLFVCGYGAHAELKKNTCESCTALIHEGKGTNVDDEFFDAMQRGGLMVPSNLLLVFFKHMCAIFQAILKDSQLKTQFLTGSHQRMLLRKLSMLSFREENEFPSGVCDRCGKQSSDVFQSVSFNLSNIIFKNYSTISSEKSVSKKRKLNNF